MRASEVDGFAAAALDELGIDVHRHHAKTFDDVDPASFDLIVTLSPEAHHSALEFTRGTATEVEYWPMPDPSAVEGSRETRLDAYRRTRDQVLARLKTRFGGADHARDRLARLLLGRRQRALSEPAYQAARCEL